MELTSEERDQAIRALTARRSAYKKIAENVGCEFTDVHKSEIKKDIAFAQKALITLNLQKSIEGFTRIVHSEGAIGEERKCQVDDYKEVMRAGGVLPSQSGTSVFINNLNAQVNLFDNPMVKQLMERHNGVLEGYDPAKEMEDVIDAEVLHA